MTWVLAALLVLTWHLAIGEFVLDWVGGERYRQWKASTSIRQVFLAVFLWPIRMMRERDVEP